jgi:hypothetical protein
MNKNDIIEIMQKKPTNLVVLSAVFVGMMMVFLIPIIIENAEAVINARAISLGDSFSNVEGEMFAGRFIEDPRNYGQIITWRTAGNGVFGGDEFGFVHAKVGEVGEVTFVFSNPRSGPNTCDVRTTSDLIRGTCNISRGNLADATFQIFPLGQDNQNKKYCDILDKFASNVQTKIIREKLHC